MKFTWAILNLTLAENLYKQQKYIEDSLCKWTNTKNEKI